MGAKVKAPAKARVNHKPNQLLQRQQAGRPQRMDQDLVETRLLEQEAFGKSSRLLLRRHLRDQKLAAGKEDQAKAVLGRGADDARVPELQMQQQFHNTTQSHQQVRARKTTRRIRPRARDNNPPPWEPINRNNLNSRRTLCSRSDRIQEICRSSQA